MAKMHKVRLSSSLTVVWKFVFPALSLGLLTYATIFEIDYSNAAVFPTLVIIILFAVPATLILLSAKNISIDDECLYIDNFFKEDKIYFIDLKNVYYIPSYPHLIILRLSKKSKFGKWIIFFGKTRLFLYYATHPTVHKLKARIKIR